MSSSKQIAETILSQLGGGRFKLMTGSKNFVCGTDAVGDYLQFKIIANNSKCNLMKVSYNYGKDLYVVSFMTYRAMKLTVKKVIDEVYAEDLQDIFTRETGLLTSL